MVLSFFCGAPVCSGLITLQRERRLRHGSNHYGLTDTNLPEDARADSNAQTLDQATVIETAARVSAEFLKADLKGDATAVSNVCSGGLGINGLSIIAER